jgi:hypothetical protein
MNGDRWARRHPVLALCALVALYPLVLLVAAWEGVKEGHKECRYEWREISSWRKE